MKNEQKLCWTKLTYVSSEKFEKFRPY